MTHILIAIALIALSAIGYRVRGSGYFSDLPPGFLFGFSRGDRLFKLAIGAAPVALAAYAAGAHWYYALAVWPLVMLADTLPHAAFQGAAGTLQVMGMSALAIAPALAPAGALWLSGQLWWPAPALALLAGPAYWLGNHSPFNFVWGMFALRKGPEVGEFFYGATRALFALA